jgi:uncharacterized Zn finger protein
MKPPPDDDRRARWRDWDEYRATKKPPPEHGIKVKKAGTTWWGQRWIEALERVLGGDAGRLGRGRTYARAGRTHDLAVHGGRVVARVTGTRPQPYEVAIELVQLTDAEWQAAIAGMSTQAQFAAQLLGGEMPQAIDDVFRAAGCSLFPEQRSDLQTSCSCPDWGNPCKHVAATHYVLGEALDRDPFLLFELRGRSKTQVLEALRLARAHAAPASKTSNASATSDATSEPALAPRATTLLDTTDYDRPPTTLPSLEFSFDAPTSHAAVLRQLGVPAAWQEDLSPADALAPLVQRAAEAARRIALAEASTSEPAEPAHAAPLSNLAQHDNVALPNAKPKRFQPSTARRTARPKPPSAPPTPASGGRKPKTSRKAKAPRRKA